MSACDRDLVTTAVWIRKSLLCWSPAFRITCRHWGKALVSIILPSKAGLLPPPLPPLLLCSIFILFHSASSLLPRRLFPFEPSASSQSYRLRPLKCKVAIEEPIDLVYSLYTSISAESRQPRAHAEHGKRTQLRDSRALLSPSSWLLMRCAFPCYCWCRGDSLFSCFRPSAVCSRSLPF